MYWQEKKSTFELILDFWNKVDFFKNGLSLDFSYADTNGSPADAVRNTYTTKGQTQKHYATVDSQ